VLFRSALSAECFVCRIPYSPDSAVKAVTGVVTGSERRRADPSPAVRRGRGAVRGGTRSGAVPGGVLGAARRTGPVCRRGRRDEGPGCSGDLGGEAVAAVRPIRLPRCVGAVGASAPRGPGLRA